MGVFLTIVVFLGMLFFLITCHEMGHFLASRRAGIVVEEFGFGFPPRLFAFKRGDTTYSINLIPAGAFVRPIGEDDPNVEGGLASKGPWPRIGVYAAGPLVNVVLAFVFITFFFMSITTTRFSGNQGVMVYSVAEGSVAEQAGLRPGDVVVSVDDALITELGDIGDAVNVDPEVPKAVVLQRGGVELDPIAIQPQYSETQKRYVLGVSVSSWLDLVTGVEAGSPAADAIKPGDAIVQVDGEWVYSRESFARALDEAAAGGEDFLVVLDRMDSDPVEVTLPPLAVSGGAIVGVSTEWVSGASIEEEGRSLTQAMGDAWDFAIHLPSLIKDSLPLIQENPGSAVMGPVGAARLTVEVVRVGGFASALFLGGLISLSLAMFNFLPVPPLDGGGMLIALIEGLMGAFGSLGQALSHPPRDFRTAAIAFIGGLRRGRRLSQKAVRFAYVAGTAMMIVLTVVVFYNDIANWIKGDQISGL